MVQVYAQPAQWAYETIKTNNYTQLSIILLFILKLTKNGGMEEH